MLRTLRPQYAKSFRCIGPDCEDTCCQGWDVVIDQDAYEGLRALPDFVPKFKEHLVVIGNATVGEYARIELTSSCTCPFLSVERLCSIQVEHGERYLPNICADYPRATQRIDGLRETALMLACPEAARLVLLNPDLVQLEDAGMPRYQRFAHMGERPMKANGSPHQFLWEVRAFAILLLRDRDYPLWQRIFLLGMFCQRLHEITAAHQIELVPQLLREHADLIATGRLRPLMEGIPVRTAMQLATVLEIIKRHLDTTAGKHPRFRDCIKDFLKGIQCEEEAPIENCASFFDEANAQYCSPFLEQHPYMLENFLLNYVFRTRFPYGETPRGVRNNPLTEFLMLCILFTLVKELAVGAAGLYREKFDAGHIVKIVQSVSKSVEQCPKFPLAHYVSLTNADGIALLLKNNS